MEFSLCLMAGHFCMSSCRWRFAAAEYTRALYRCPKDELAALCLAVALLAQATSHGVQVQRNTQIHNQRQEYFNVQGCL